MVTIIVLASVSAFIVPRILFQFSKHVSRQAAVAYHCPMHPAYTSDRPGDCPICNMKLVPKGHKILYYRNPMGEPDTSPVPKKDAMGMDYIPVYEDEVTGMPSSVKGYATIQIPAEKQQLMGVKTEIVQKQKLFITIRAAGQLQTGSSIRIKKGDVYVYGTIYEHEAPFVKKGNRVKVHVPAFDAVFTGEVVSVNRIYDIHGFRAFRVRAVVKNSEKDLPSYILVDMEIEGDLGEVVAVPHEAVILTGERAIIFVAKGNGFFEPREVRLGSKAENFYEVKEGVQPGESVVVGANFLIDSESRLQGAVQMNLEEHPNGT